MNENYVQLPAWNAPWCESGAQNADNIQHDVAEELRIIAKGKVDLMLMALLSAGRISNVLHGANDGNFFRSQQYKIVTRPHKLKLSDSDNIIRWLREKKHDFQDSLKQAYEIMNREKEKNIFDMQSTGPYNMCAPSRKSDVISKLQEQLKQIDDLSSLLYRSTINYSLGQVLYNNENGNECPDCPQFLHLLAGNTCNNCNCSNYNNLQVYLSRQSMPSLVEIFAMQEGITTEEAVEKIMDKFGIKMNEPFAAIPIAETATAHHIKNIRKMPDRPNFRNIPFMSSANSLLGFAAVNQTVENKRLVVPVTAWSFSGSNEFFFPVPFEKPYPLLNWNLIVQNPDAEIFLSESIELADVNTNKYNQYSRIIWTAWLGGKETAADVNWEILRNRKVTIVIHNNLKDSVESVLAAYFSLKPIAGVTIEFQNK